MSKIAYLILAHTDPDHLNRLINSLNYNCDFYIHIDGKSSLESFSELSQYSNVTFCLERKSIYWADISMIDATLELIKIALASNNSYCHLTLISGYCYPIKTANDISSFLNSSKDKQFMKFVDMRNCEKYISFVKNKWFKEPFYKGSSLPIIYLDKILRRLMNMLQLKNKWNIHLVPYFGSQWWALTPECCRYILDYLASNPMYYEKFKYSFSPDEHFFHTIIGNSPFASQCSGEIAIQENRGENEYYLTNLHFTDPSLLKWFTTKDFDKLLLSEKLFVRKVSSSKSISLIDKLDTTIHNSNCAKHI